ncbi:GyrI-like domain-containing protein [Mangrovivirga sp. M17]|uniref:GyrI-like domain-containing protein n=1 Tax=Mangrovivirga halotolerans TaxID=2993936 RepID=A0ABT3RPC6_9BACT|nr:GyrI-like domain-containing protein [Mangrovivirga halotolerans]MCX2743331.1 GyrI-like domain-containing protein [Mangrovivirga halotolerans]
MPLSNKETQIDYKIRINKVFQFIDNNLDADLSLSRVSEVAAFSPFHFHRIFKYITGETLNEFVTRRKIEKSALDLLHKDLTITEIAFKNGFKDNSSFTRAFKKFYSISPSEFKKQNPNRFSKIRQLDSKNGQDLSDYEKYLCVIDNLKKHIDMNAKVEIINTEKLPLAYLSVIGPKNLPDAFQKIMRWATPKGLMNEQTKMATIYHDSFKVTEADKVRISACMLINKPVETEGEIELTAIEPGKHIKGSFEIGLDEFEKSWRGLFVWMNDNGYKKADKDPFEIYHNNFNEHPEKKAIVDFYIPIE